MITGKTLCGTFPFQIYCNDDNNNTNNNNTTNNNNNNNNSNNYRALEL